MRILELHMAMDVVQRSERRSAVAAAAYISGTKIRDERTDTEHDYTRRQGVEFTGMALPDDAPEWAHDRARLWNEAEAREKHPRAQTARSMVVNMPDEFTAEHRRETGLKIAHLLTRYGAVDYALHQPDRKGDQRNHHGHFLFTTRRFENGVWAKNKDRVLDDRVKGPEEYKKLRVEIAGIINDIAVREQLPVYVENLSFKDRGLDREATHHLGWKAMEMERRGEETELGKKNREITARNERRRQLDEERKVIDIEIARERMREKEQRQQSPAPQTQDERYEAFYRDTYERRASMLDGFQRQHGQREKQLRQEAARVSGSLESAGFFARVWRGVTGRTQAEKEQLADAQAQLQEIEQQRQQARAQFERDRLIRIEALKAQAAREILDEEALPRAVGETARARTETRARAMPPTTAPEQAPPEKPEAGRPDPTAEQKRRREYFRSLGAEKKRAREQTPQPERRPEETASVTEQPAPDTTQAAPPSLREIHEAASDPKPKPNAERQRRGEYFRQLGRSRSPERDNGPTHE